MRIPSPRKFFEIAAFCVFAFCMTIGVIIACALLFMIWALETIYDRSRAWRSRGRA